MKIALESDQYYRFYADDGFYRYSFNGKEKENEIASGDLDFGARIYDSRLGRWFKTDIAEAEYPSWSPYRFGLNNPVRYLDHGGAFEIDEATAAAYPKLDAYLQNLSVTYAGKPEEFKKAFKQYSQMSDEQVEAMIAYKKVPNDQEVVPNQPCPRVKVEDMEGKNAYTPVNGTYNGSALEGKAVGTIILDIDMVKTYEQQMTNPTDKTSQEAAKLWLESTLFHEGTHYGDMLDGKMDNSVVTMQNGKITFKGGSSVESGKDFEEAVYGEDIAGTGGTTEQRFQAVKDYVTRKDYNKAATMDKIFGDTHPSNSGPVFSDPGCVTCGDEPVGL